MDVLRDPRIETMTAKQLNELADRMVSETAKRGLFVRTQAAILAGRLRTLAERKRPATGLG